MSSMYMYTHYYYCSSYYYHMCTHTHIYIYTIIYTHTYPRITTAAFWWVQSGPRQGTCEAAGGVSQRHPCFAEAEENAHILRAHLAATKWGGIHQKMGFIQQNMGYYRDFMGI